MKLFDSDGHVTDEGLRGLISEELDEMGLLEVSEHLDFCDRCVERYSELLTVEVEIAPPVELAPTIVYRIRQRVRAVFLNRFTRVSVAAVLAMGIWVGGFYQNGLLTPSDQFLDTLSDTTKSFARQVRSWGNGLDDILSSLNAFFSGLGNSQGNKPAK